MSQLLMNNLQNPALFKHPVKKFQVHETHSSLVLTTGDYVYKIKKPVNFGFLDYSTLDQRKYYCEREIEFNSILAENIYIGVVGIYGSEENPSFEPSGEPFEYAVKMRQFPQDNIFSQLLAKNKITHLEINKLAKVIADFHQQTLIAGADTVRGDAEHIHQFAMANFSETLVFLKDPADIAQLKTLEKMTQAHYDKIHQTLQLRKDKGMVRRCHGDMHLNNIVLIDNQPVIFDCIEFNEDFIWTDVMGDLGFIIMDFVEHKKPELAHWLLNYYLELTGDYSALQILPYFCAYRAMVRAKVDQIRLAQPGLSASDQQHINQHYQTCLSLVADYLKPKQPNLMIMHGFCGSGKSTVAQNIVATQGVIQLRSDVERKRLAGLEFTHDSKSALYDGLYTAEITTDVYNHLAQLAKQTIHAGYSVVVDAAFIRHDLRQQFFKLAMELGVEFKIIDCQASDEVLSQRVTARQQFEDEISEGRLEILEHQIENHDPLSTAELGYAIVINTEDR